ncbi:hypothetical protein ELG97_00880 [Rhizobium leguminosarum]|nr:hypothetical protein ELG97_00880 [Rhizobium leguminosarum]
MKSARALGFATSRHLHHVPGHDQCCGNTGSCCDLPAERELIVRLHATKEDIPKCGVVIDATLPLAVVVDEILRLSRACDHSCC